MTLFECVPNFSEGRRTEVIEAVRRAAEGVAGSRVLDLESNADHNRSVLTLAGPGEALVEAAYRATEVAVQQIDLTRHQGEHPRMGAMDVVPFVPLGTATMEEAITLARRFGERVSTGLGVPVYFYGRAATRPDREDLAKVREGQFEGLREAALRDPQRRPDLGGPALHPTAGAMAVGARPILVAYNAYLNTADVGAAKRIAHAIRARDGGLAEVKALGFEIRERNRAQVSMNMTDVRRTPLHRALALIREEAARYGLTVEETEIVGLVPEDALLDAAEHHLQLNHFSRSGILERRLRETTAPGPGAGALSHVEGSLRAFSDALASRTPTPGGGSAAALVGALGVSLGLMVLRYSAAVGGLSPEGKADEVALESLRRTLLSGVDDDPRAYDLVRARRPRAKGGPATPEEQAAYRDALLEAAKVPLSIARACRSGQERLQSLAPRVKPVMLSDLTTARALLRAGLEGALANAEINLRTLEDLGEGAPGLWGELKELRASGP
jgi:glutamate formiminotransferase/formiminotetrahydrofolate cyclodeaminase